MAFNLSLLNKQGRNSPQIHSKRVKKKEGDRDRDRQYIQREIKRQRQSKKYDTQRERYAVKGEDRERKGQKDKQILSTETQNGDTKG